MRKSLLLVVILLLAGLAQAQRMVTGKVTSGEDNESLPGVNVVVQGTTRGTVTDVSGNYSIQLEPGDDALVFTFVGFKTQTVSVGQQSTLDIVLETDATALEEVVVIGYGTIRKSDLTGSVSSLKTEDIAKIPTSSPALSLQGKVTGVQVAPSSGAPGSGAYVRIRGIGTFNDSSPIFVVDGVILNNIDFLNPADIQSMEVLKDASATAIYGSRGANGVIIVTTKKGIAGREYPSINVSADYSIQYLPKKIDLLNGREFAIISNEIIPGSYNNVDAVPNTDWQDLLFRAAPMQTYQVSVAGATDKIDYYIGLGYFSQDGIIPKSKYERVTIKFNNTYHLSKRIRFGNNITVTPDRRQNTNLNSVFVVYRAHPTLEPFQPDGSYTAIPGVGNFYADIDNTNSFSNSIRTVGNIFGEVDILDGLTFRSSAGVDIAYGKAKSFTPVFYVSPQQQNPTSKLNKSYGNFSSVIWENTLNYNKLIGKHRVDVLGGFTTQEIKSESLGASGENILRDGEDFWYLNPSNVNPNTINNSVGDFNTLLSLLFRTNYTYDNRYLFTTTYRRDGSSKFTKDNRFADFWSLALGWNIINESFMSGIPNISNLKLRTSYGSLGNEKIPYLRQFSLISNNDPAVFGAGDVLVSGGTYDVTGNPNLVWETTYQADVGLEIGFFEDALTVEMDYYHRKTEGILIDLPVPGYLGNGDGAAITFNAAEVVNQGFEYNIGYRGKIGQLSYRVSTLGTTVDNKATKVQGFGGPGDYVTNGAGTTRTRPGLPLGAFYGYKVNGVFQNQAELDAYPHRSEAGIGDLRFVDVDKNGILDSDDRTYLGSPIPTFIYGLSLEGEFKGFDLSIDFAGQSGNKIYNQKETVRPDLYNFEQRYFDRWTGDGTSNTQPRSSNGGYNFLPSSHFIQDGSYFRLRSVTIGYTLPPGLVQKVYMQKARVYARGTNLLTISKFTGYGPEVVNGSPINNGIDTSGYPSPAIVSFGLNLTF